MREIEFRGKDNSVVGIEQKWLFGMLGVDKHGRFNITYTEKHPLGCTPYLQTKTVDPATVGQFTGLFDKDGNKIFEGDILSYDDKPYGQVVYLIGEFRVLKIKPKGYVSLAKYHNVCKIIGIIHDDPNLLEEVGK